MEDIDEGADADADADADVDGDGDGDDDGEDEDDANEDADDDEDQDDTLGRSDTSQMQNGTIQDASSSRQNPSVRLASASPHRSVTPSNAALPIRPNVRPEALTASSYDIVPTIAAPHSTSINTITATPDMRWVFSGGADGYIRKFNWVDTANSKLMLTVAQRHPFVDSVTKAGVLLSYWENEETSGQLSMLYCSLQSF